ncbi:MAG: YlbF family regulator, partial [Lachnospiraceae bacterium]|nr:YlbF family regulator [Lachnospiraceae bacterium]
MLDSIVKKATENFIEEIRKSGIYREYDYQKEKLKKQPELFAMVSEYRRRNFALQTEAPGEG